MRTLFALLLLAPLSTAQTVWYVDDDGTPPGTGTLADPFTSIQYAIDQVPAVGGTELWVQPGTYVENVVLHAGAWRLLGLGGPDECLLMPAGPGPVVSLPLGGYVEGFTITGCQDPSGGALRTASLGFAGITDCLVRDNAGHGLELLWDYDLFGCTITRNGGAGVYQPSPQILDVRQNIVQDNGAPPTFKGYGLATNVVQYNNFPPEASNLFGPKVWPNVNADPLFVDPANGDFRLQPGSPSIDTGDATGPLDPDGSLPEQGVYPHDASSDPGAYAYCLTQDNAIGCEPSIGGTGSASFGGAPFEVTCSSVTNNKLGLLFYGYKQKFKTYQGGYLCVAGAIRRTPVQSSGGNPTGSDCSGVFTYDFDALIQSGSDPALMVGEVVYAQYWFRDPFAFSSLNTGRSDGLKFAILP